MQFLCTLTFTKCWQIIRNTGVLFFFEKDLKLTAIYYFFLQSPLWDNWRQVIYFQSSLTYKLQNQDVIIGFSCHYSSCNKSYKTSQTWWHTPVMPVLRRLRKRGHGLEVSLGCTAISSEPGLCNKTFLKKKKIKLTNKSPKILQRKKKGLEGGRKVGRLTGCLTNFSS